MGIYFYISFFFIIFNSYPVHSHISFINVKSGNFYKLHPNTHLWADKKKKPPKVDVKKKDEIKPNQNKRTHPLTPMSLDNHVISLRSARIHRNSRRKSLIEKFKNRRALLKLRIKEAKSLDERIHWHYYLQNLPRDSSPTRYRNRCQLTGRPRGYSGFFGVSRQMARTLIQKGFFPGVETASW